MVNSICYVVMKKQRNSNHSQFEKGTWDSWGPLYKPLLSLWGRLVKKKQKKLQGSLSTCCVVLEKKMKGMETPSQGVETWSLAFSFTRSAA